MSVFGKVADVIAGSVGKTTGEMFLDLVKATYPPNHPEVLFAEWFTENISRLEDACADLGIQPPKPGKGLYHRLQAAVMPVLETQRAENPHMGKGEG